MQAHEWPAELDHDARIGWQTSLADNSADGTFAADQNGFDVAAVLEGGLCIGATDGGTIAHTVGEQMGGTSIAPRASGHPVHLPRGRAEPPAISCCIDQARSNRGRLSGGICNLRMSASRGVRKHRNNYRRC